MTFLRRFGFLALGLVAVVSLTSCYKSPVISIPPGAAPRFFVADLNNGLVVFTQPIGSTSTPSFTKAGAGTSGVVVDRAGNVYVSNGFTETIQIFAPGFSASSTPTTTIGPIAGAATIEGMAFDSSGNLYVADELGTQIFIFAPPFGSAVPTATMTGLPFGPVGIVFDRAGDMLVPSFGSGIVTVFRPPFVSGSNTPAATMTMPNHTGGIGIDLKDHLVVGQVDGTLAIVTPPFATGVTPSAFIPQPLIAGSPATEPLNSTFDSSGNLWQTYGGDDGVPGQSGVAVFAPPFTSVSTPLFTFTGGLSFPFSDAFGP